MKKGIGICLLVLGIMLIAIGITCCSVGTHEAVYTLPDGTQITMESTGTTPMIIGDLRIAPKVTDDLADLQIGGIAGGFFLLAIGGCLVILSD